MNQEHFLTELKIYLNILPENQINHFLNYYRDQFRTMAEEKELSEEAISQHLGSPKKVAEKILKELNLQLPEKKSALNDWQEFTTDEVANDDFEKQQPSRLVRTFQILGLLALNAFLMVWVIFSVVVLLFSFWLAAFVLLGSPIIVVIAIPLVGSAWGLFQLFFSIFLCGIGIIGTLILWPVSRVIWYLIKRYTQWNVKILFKGAD